MSDLEGQGSGRGLGWRVKSGGRWTDVRVLVICFCFGVGLLTPYNSLVLSLDYLDAPSLDGIHAKSDIPIVYTVVQIPVLLLVVAFGDRLPHTVRIFVPFVAFVAVCLMWPPLAGQGLGVAVGLTVLVALFNSVLQSSLYNFASLISPAAASLLLTGMGGAGILSSVMRLVTMATIPDDAARSMAIFFYCSAAVCAVCMVMFVYIMTLPDARAALAEATDATKVWSCCGLRELEGTGSSAPASVHAHYTRCDVGDDTGTPDASLLAGAAHQDDHVLKALGPGELADSRSPLPNSGPSTPMRSGAQASGMAPRLSEDGPSTPAESPAFQRQLLEPGTPFVDRASANPAEQARAVAGARSRDNEAGSLLGSPGAPTVLLSMWGTPLGPPGDELDMDKSWDRLKAAFHVAGVELMSTFLSCVVTFSVFPAVAISIPYRGAFGNNEAFCPYWPVIMLAIFNVFDTVGRKSGQGLQLPHQWMTAASLLRAVTVVVNVFLLVTPLGAGWDWLAIINMVGFAVTNGYVISTSMSVGNERLQSQYGRSPVTETGAFAFSLLLALGMALGSIVVLPVFAVVDALGGAQQGLCPAAD